MNSSNWHPLIDQVSKKPGFPSLLKIDDHPSPNKEFEVDLKLSEDVGRIAFPIWSEENGQDDLVWYPAKKVAPGHCPTALSRP